MKALLHFMRFFTILPVLFCMYVGCTLSSGISGTGSQAGNGIVVATVKNPDQSVAVGAKVFIRKECFLEDTGSINSTKIADAITDSKGYFALDSIKPGRYLIEINDGSRNALLVSCVKESTVVEDSAITNLGTLVLEPNAGFSGSVNRENVDNSVTIYVQIYGLKHAVKVDLSGKFTFEDIPAGTFKLRIFPSDATLGVVDSQVIKVDPAEILDAGNFFLPFEYWRDTLIVRSILDSNGKFDIPVADVITQNNGRITELNLTEMEISILPESIGKLRIITLLLGSNYIEEFPEEIGTIASLEYLSLTNNAIRGIPSSIGNLKKLKHLDLSVNYIRMIPPEIGELTSLENLILCGNGMDKFPWTIGELTGLKVLDLSYNRLTMLPFEITNITGLTYLSVNYNGLIHQPSEIEQWLNTYSTDKAWKVTQKPGIRATNEILHQE